MTFQLSIVCVSILLLVAAFPTDHHHLNTRLTLLPKRHNSTAVHPTPLPPLHLPYRFPRQEDDSPSSTKELDLTPTPPPTGDPDRTRTVFINDTSNFAILLPETEGGNIASSEGGDAVAFCMGSSIDSDCRPFKDGFITASAVEMGGSSDNSWIQVTGCINSTVYGFDENDQGGQFDVRYPNGALCTHGGYGASFIEQVEPAASRFCLRCCSSPNDQENCNSHQDRAGCVTAVPGTYDFPDIGVSCS